VKDEQPEMLVIHNNMFNRIRNQEANSEKVDKTALTKRGDNTQLLKKLSLTLVLLTFCLTKICIIFGHTSDSSSSCVGVGKKTGICKSSITEDPMILSTQIFT